MLSYLSKSLIVLVASIVSISAFTPSSPLQTFRPVVTVTNTHTQPCSINLTPKPIQMTSLQLSSSSSDEDNKEGVLSKLNAWRKKTFAKKSPDDLTFKQKLAKAGLSVLLSYGFVSNMSYTVTVSLAWYVFTKTVRIMFIYICRDTFNNTLYKFWVELKPFLFIFSSSSFIWNISQTINYMI